MADSARSKRPAKEEAGATKKKGKVGKDKKEKLQDGVAVFCGSAHWTASVDSKVTHKMLVTPHKFAAMAGRQVTRVVMGPSALSGFLITKQGSAFAFGRNDAGQLGLGDEKTRSFPRKVNVEARIVNAACGRRHALLLGEDGQVYACGKNDAGQLGIGKPKVASINTPTQILAPFGKIIKVACGAEFSMVLNDQGELYAFGHPDKGCLGNGTNGEYFVSASKLSYHFEYSPILVGNYCEKIQDDEYDGSAGRERAEKRSLGAVFITDVACGPQHTVAIAETGEVFTWGFGGYGRLGHNSNEDEMFPRSLLHFKPTNPHTGGAKQVSVGGFANYAVTRSTEHLWFWGQLKTSGEATMYPKPSSEILDIQLNQMSVGAKHVVLSANANHEAWSMGSSPCYGELGYGEDEGKSSTKFKKIGPLENVPVLDIACGLAQTVILCDTRTIEARKALYELPNLGTLTDVHSVLGFVHEARDYVGEKDHATTLSNVREIVEFVGKLDDKSCATLKKSLDTITTVITDVFAAAKEVISTAAAGKFDVAPDAEPTEELDAVNTFMNAQIKKHGADADAIAKAINATVSSKIKGKK
eukprot:m.932265 g.932265  ORF g.932265 m.932265 type:complete len:585 (-) comp23787_c1_seq12:1873-3627(-)